MTGVFGSTALLLLASLQQSGVEASLAVSTQRICATTASGRTVTCIEHGDVWSVELPEDVAGTVVDLHAGTYPLCVRAEPSNTLLCWADEGQTQLERAEGVHDVAWGDDHLCALRDGGVVECWGNNDQGQLGDGTRVYRAKPTKVDLPPAIQLSASAMGTCALLEDRTVRCWGDNPAWGDTRRLEPEPVPGLTHVRELRPQYTAVSSAGDVVTWSTYDDRVALFSDPVPLTTPDDDSKQRLRCWLDGGSVRCREKTRTRVPGIANAIEMAGSVALGCARDADQHIECWSSTERFMLPDPPFSWTPERIADVAGAASLSLRKSSACALDGAGEVQCWTTKAARVELPAPAVQLQAGGALTCARGKGGIWCWDDASTTPQLAFEGVARQRFVPGSASRVCVGGRTMRCKAVNGRPRGTSEDFELPIAPQLLLDGRPCARREGRLQCWRGSWRGTPPQLVDDAFDVRGLSRLVAHDQQVCGVDRAGKFSCKKPLARTCEVGTRLRRCRDAHVEAELDGSSTLILASGMGCTLDRSGEVRCWQTTAQGPPPAPNPLATIALPAPARSVSVAESTACAALEDGTVWCWGRADGPVGARHQPARLGWSAVPMPWLDGGA